jgi:L-rhamnose mutarotase
MEVPTPPTPWRVPMERALFYLRIFPGTEAEYDRRHAEIWPELVEEIRESGIHNFSGFRRGTDVWYYGEYEPDARTAFAVHGPKPANQRWNRYFRDVIAQITDDAGELIFYDEVFHTNEGPVLEDPMQRGLISLVIDPERAADYEALHAEPWPDLIEAIADSGYRNYSGFRRGANVVYYGEYHPDMATVVGKMSRHEVNARWGDAFKGIITTITQPDGSLITAHEIYHQD